MSSVVQPLWLKHEDVPVLPDGWCVMRTDEACVQLKPGKLYDQKTVSEAGEVPVINQSENGFHGYHSNDPGVSASFNFPVVTFANHTCVMRVVRQPFSMIQNVFPKVGKPGVTDTVYFYYASIGRVNLSDYKGHHPLFRMMYIPIPPLQTQRKIAAILSAYDDLIENNLRRIKILEEMAQNLYREWFVKFRFPGYEKVKVVDSPLGMIPEGWSVAELHEVVREHRNTVKPESLPAGTRYLGLEHLPRKSIALMNWGYSDEINSTKLTFERDDILFGKIRPYFHKVGIAPYAGICSTDIIVIRPLIQDYLYIGLGCISSVEFIDYAAATSQGTKMPRADWNVLLKYPVVIPNTEMLYRFNAIMTGILTVIHNYISQTETLRNTRDLLLPKLISGEVDVSDLDIKVPEEVIE